MTPKFNIGDKISYVNDYGIVWENKTITGIYEYKQEGILKDYWYYITPCDAPWCPKPERNLILKEKLLTWKDL